MAFINEVIDDEARSDAWSVQPLRGIRSEHEGLRGAQGDPVHDDAVLAADAWCESALTATRGVADG